MAEITHELLKVFIMVVVIAIARFLIPCIRARLGNERAEMIRLEVEKLVLATQQRCQDSTGSEKLSVVIYKIRQFLDERNISVTEEQIRDYIEAAVKTMKILDG